jgi:hypothetical protein
MIVGISGYALSGKNTVAELIKAMQPEKNWQIKGFSHKLKQVASLLTGIPSGMFESQDFKKLQLPGWNMDVRLFLQKLGTDAVRDGLHKDAWVNAMFCDYKEEDNWLIVDCRFPNEAEMVKAYGGKVIRIVRGEPVNTHPSETALDHWDFDFIMHNSKDIDFLTKSVQAFLYDRTTYIPSR